MAGATYLASAVAEPFSDASPRGSETVLRAFTQGSDGAGPLDSLFRDIKDNFYGTTYYGGATNVGTAFKLAKDGMLTPLHSFAGESDEGDGHRLRVLVRTIWGLPGSFPGTE